MTINNNCTEELFLSPMDRVKNYTHLVITYAVVFVFEMSGYSACQIGRAIFKIYAYCEISAPVVVDRRALVPRW